MPRVVDITGQKFGRLTVVHQMGLDSSDRALWLCTCECGKTKTIRGSRLRSGATQSCGCLRQELSVASGRAGAGSNNGMWKGENAGYFAMHIRVNAVRGRPPRCEQCGTTDPTKTYEWANLTGKYGDVNDYRRMCRSCHRKYDGIKPPARRKGDARVIRPADWLTESEAL